jgi:hypothetical protein
MLVLCVPMRLRLSVSGDTLGLKGVIGRHTAYLIFAVCMSMVVLSLSLLRMKKVR